MRRMTLFVLVAAAFLAGCTGKLKRENEALRDEIDSRREALEEAKQEGLEQARSELARLDTLLEQARREHDAQHQWVMDHAKELDEQAPEVQRLNRLRLLRDSLQVEFEVQAKKIQHFMRQLEK